MNVPTNLYTFWTGDDEMSSNRTNSLDILKRYSGLNVLLVTKDNLSDYLIAPIHKGYEYLSSTHKSDYLRSYFMYHHGGCYCDLKPFGFDWRPYIAQLNDSHHTFMVRQTPGDNVIYPGKDAVCCGRYISKRGSDFAREWYKRTNQKMDAIYDELKAHPGTYHPRATRDGDLDGVNQPNGYPLWFFELLGGVIHPLSYERPNDYLTGLPEHHSVMLTGAYR